MTRDEELQSVKEAIEKQIPQEPVLEEIRKGYSVFYCPRCKSLTDAWLPPYCAHCGQRLDWREYK